MGQTRCRENGQFLPTYQRRAAVDSGNTRLDEIVRRLSAVRVDGRTDEQFYAGGKHPKAAKAGRIPSAVLMDQDKAYSPEGNRLKSRDELASIYNDLGDKTIVSYCNTGHWAATNWFVMSEILGRKHVKLYDGSMVEWTANTNLPLDTSGKSNMQNIKDIFSNLLG